MPPEFSCLWTTTWNSEVHPPDLATTPVTQLIGGTSNPGKPIKRQYLFLKNFVKQKEITRRHAQICKVYFFNSKWLKMPSSSPVTVRRKTRKLFWAHWHNFESSFRLYRKNFRKIIGIEKTC
jgi:hypothetical protein